MKGPCRAAGRGPLGSTKHGPVGLLDLALATGVVIWVTVLFIAFQPGILSIDSIIQLSQGLAGRYDNHHPPLMSWLVGVCVRAVGAPWPVLLADLLSLGGGMALLARYANRDRAVAWALLAVFLVLPSTWAVAVTIWKDVLMAAALLMGVLLLRVRRPGLALLALAVATAMRHNAVVASIPLAGLAVRQLAPALGRARHALATAATIAALAVLPRLIDVAFHAKDSWILGERLVHDLVGIYMDDPAAFPSSQFAREVTLSQLSSRYSAPCVVSLYSSGIDFGSLPERRGVVMREWVAQIGRHPGTYLARRWQAFRDSLAIGSSHVCFPYMSRTDPNPWGFGVRSWTRLYRFLRAAEDWGRDAIYFRGWLWLLLAALLAVAGSWSSARLAAATGFSGALYALAYFFVGVCCDYRYVYWTMVSVFAAAILLLGRDLGDGAVGDAPPDGGNASS